MVGKRSSKSAEIQCYIKGRNEPKTIYNEIYKVYGDNEVFYRLVRNWIGKFNNTIQDTSRSGGPRTAVTPKTCQRAVTF